MTPTTSSDTGTDVTPAPFLDEEVAEVVYDPISPEATAAQRGEMSAAGTRVAEGKTEEFVGPHPSEPERLGYETDGNFEPGEREPALVPTDGSSISEEGDPGTVVPPAPEGWTPREESDFGLAWERAEAGPSGPDEPPDVEADPPSESPPIREEVETPKEEPVEEEAAEEGTSTKATVDEVLAEVGDDQEKARAALKEEQASEKPRATLVAKLEAIIAK